MIPALLLALLPTAAGTVDPCLSISMSPAHYAQIASDERSGTHLWFPEPIEYRIVANEQLWEVDAYGHHFFVKPAVDTGADGATTTFTIITKSRSYDFRINRESDLTTHCYRINHASVAGGLAATRAFGGAVVSAPSSHLNGGVASISPPGSPPRPTPPSLINTNYEYKSPILAVWDDGRRTYLRAQAALPGLEAALLTASGGAVVSYRYDQATATYTVDGVHSSLDLVLAGERYTASRTGHGDD